MPTFPELFLLQTKDAHDIASSGTLASLLEVSAYPKPGNVHRTRDFPDTRYEHFLAAGVAIYPALFEAASAVIDLKYPEQRPNLLGETIFKATQRTRDWQGGGNVNLGEILLFAPLVISAGMCIREKQKRPEDLRENAATVVKRGTVQDGMMVYQAFQVANPGNMGSRERYDVTNPNALQEIHEDQMTFWDLFLLNDKTDDVSAELVRNFARTFEEGVPTLREELYHSGDTNASIVNTFLFLLASKPDSFIVRKAGEAKAREVQDKAREILKQGGMQGKEGDKNVWALDATLQKENGRLNPGTTADIVGATLLVACLCGFRP